MIRIVFIIGQLGVGGGERQLYLVIKNLNRSQFQPTVITLNPGQDEYWEKPIQDLGVEVLGVQRTWNKFERVVQTVKILRQKQAHLVHSWDFRHNWIAALSSRLAGTSVCLGSVRSNLYKEGRTELYRRHGLIGIHGFVANSRQGFNQLLRLGVNPGRINLVFNAVEHFEKRLTDFERIQIRNSWGARDGQIVIAAVGQLIEAKNYPLLIRATRKLLDVNCDVLTIVYGDGPEREKLLKLIVENGLQEKFLLLGQHSQARLLVSAADIFCLPSRREGMPNVLLEACMARLPPVAVDVGGVSDILESGKSGFVIPSDDIDALLKYLQRLASSLQLREQVAEAALNRVSTIFNVNQIVPTLENCYLENLLKYERKDL